MECLDHFKFSFIREPFENLIKKFDKINNKNQLDFKYINHIILMELKFI